MAWCAMVKVSRQTYLVDIEDSARDLGELKEPATTMQSKAVKILFYTAHSQVRLRSSMLPGASAFMSPTATAR